MTNRPLVVAFLAFILGGILSTISIWFLLFTGIGIWCAYKRERKRSFWIIISALYLVSGIRFSLADRSWQRDQQFLEKIEGKTCSVTGTIDKKEMKTYGCYYQLTAVHIYQEGRSYVLPTVLLIADTNQYPIQATVVATGLITPFNKARNDGNFNSYSYYKAKGIIGQMKEPKVQILSSRRSVVQILYKWRQVLGRVYTHLMNSKDAGIMKAMLLGDKEDLNLDLKDLYQRAGISHILAISGTHISIIILGFYHLIRKRSYSYLKSMSLSIVVLVLFTLMTGRAISTIRAGFMIGLYLFGQWRGRVYDVLSALALTLMLMLLYNPLALGSISLQYSVVAVCGAVYGTKSMQKHFKKIHPLILTAVVCGEIYLFTLPITIYNMHQVPLCSILLNIAIVPLVSILIVLGLIGGFIGLFSYKLAVIPLGGCHLILSYMNKVAELSTFHGHALWITGTPNAGKTCIYLLGMIIIGHYWYRKGKIRALVLQLLLVIMLLTGNAQSHFYCAILDVGQGDGTYIQGDAKHTCMIDGGSISVKQLGANRLYPFFCAHGIRQIDYWFISHADIDHYSGFLELAQMDFPIGHVVLYQGMLNDEAKSAILKVCLDHEIEVLYLKQYEQLELGEMTLQCVNIPSDETYNNRNDRSLQLIISHEKLLGFWGGDISEEVEETLAETYDLSKVNFLKISHHGAKTSSEDSFIQEISPSQAVISVGFNNFGHPSNEVIEKLEVIGAKVWITQEQGQYTYEE